jgi:ammonia channel protein AmtB
MDLYGIAGAHVVELSLWVLRWALVATVAGWRGVMVVIEWRQEEEEEEEEEDMSVKKKKKK